jgi:Fe(II)/alpha-ketoglutarate-dependent arginine beta-hydroxylase
MRASGVLEELSIRERDGVPCLRLTAAESAAVRELGEVVLQADPDQPLDERLASLVVYAHDLPVRLRSVFTEFRLTGRPYGGLVVAGLPVNESALGPTPDAYTDNPDAPEVRQAEATLLLLGSLLGDPISFATQQHGRIVLDVFPVSGHEESQLGSSSTANLEWHNEDAFHPHRADWIMLLGLRNRDQVPTTFGPVQDLDMDDELRDILFQERFIILPDESHTVEFNHVTTGVADHERVDEAFSRITDMVKNPKAIPILSGDRRAPFIRIDPAFMERDLGDEVAERALEQVIGAIDARLRDVVLDTGELFIIDNKRAVHGRKPFKARYDGTDRWLRRINVAADLRPSEDRRTGSHGRALV